MSARELMQTDDSLIKSSNFRKTTEKDFFDKDEEIKRLNAKIKGLEKKNIEQKKEINILNNKLENQDENKLSHFNSDLMKLFNNLKNNYEFKNSKNNGK